MRARTHNGAPAGARTHAPGPTRPRRSRSVWVGAELGSENVAPMQEAFAGPTSFPELSANGLGHLTRPLGTQPVDPVEGARRLADLQRHLVGRTRLGVPAIAH